MNNNDDTKITFIADHLEVPSGIPQLLIDQGFHVEFKNLRIGHYIINDQIIVERKEKNDFAMSLIKNRLFKQCAEMKHTNYHQVFLIQGNPYKTNHAIERTSIKGALISISLSWQIPIIYSADAATSAQMLIMAARQNIKMDHYIRTGYKPKTLDKLQSYFLQGLPAVGSKLAQLLLNHFGSLERVLNATEPELQEIEGIGKNKAKTIRSFLSIGKTNRTPDSA